MDERLAWAITAYMSNPDASDADVADLLVRNGVPSGVATRAVAFLPLAFGRRLLRGLITIPDSFVIDGREAPLASEPLYDSPKRRGTAGRESIERIGLRSGEFNAVNQALNAGSKPEDLELGPPHLMFDGPIVGGATTAGVLSELLASHASTLACEARVFPRRLTPAVAQGQIDVLVSAPALGERRIIESFAAYASTLGEARSAAMDRFSRGSLHPLLAALGDARHGADQVEWRPGAASASAWARCSGSGRPRRPSTSRRSWTTQAPPAGGVAVARGALVPHVRDRRTERSRRARRAARQRRMGPRCGRGDQWPWPPSEKPYALRHFFVMVPAPAT